MYGAISHNKLHGLSVPVETDHVELPAVHDGFASEGIIQFFFEESGAIRGLMCIFWMTNRAVYHHCEGSKEELVRESAGSIRPRTIVSPGSSFINFNLPQFYRMVT
ncbi:class I adenylate cyclase [Shigella flexneri]